MEPPSCLVDVYADEGNDTAKRLHYKVPVLGMEQCTEIFINLSLRQRYKSENVDFDLSKSDVSMLQSDSDSEPHKKFRKMKTTRKRKHKGTI